jgi:hypothetical protein
MLPSPRTAAGPKALVLAASGRPLPVQAAIGAGDPWLRMENGNGLDIAPPGLHPVKSASGEWPPVKGAAKPHVGRVRGGTG